MFTQSGKSIERMQMAAKRICSFMARAYGFRVQELVVDFVRDLHDVYWLVNVKAFRLEDSNYELKVKEHAHLIENQGRILELLREEANDSSKVRRNA